ncbi:GDA1/CD39 nucleoside phosphatase family protein [Wolffia australiana]
MNLSSFIARIQIMMMHNSTTRLSDLLPSATQKNGRLRLSSSLQDLPSFSNPVVFEIEGTYSRLQDAGGSSFSKEKPLVETSRRRWTRYLLYVLALALLLSLVYAFWNKNPSKYYVVLDCGSTGTRAFVYESSINSRTDIHHLPITLKSLPELVNKQKSMTKTGRAYQRMETEPGFDKLVRNESGLRAAIDPLLRWAEKQIPKNAYKSTSVFVYATAGVRRLPSSDSEWLLETVWRIVKGYSFLCQREWIQTISGMEEAFYGWIALNYKLGTLGSSPLNPTVGSLDLGGSSLQVTFQTGKVIPGKTNLNLSIGDVRHHLSAYSLSGYGLNDAFDKSVVHLLRMNSQKERIKGGKIELSHPCLQEGYKETYVCRQCEESSPVPVFLTGKPKWEECRTLAKATVNQSEWSKLTPVKDCESQPCALPDSLPLPMGKFHAMSGFYVVYNFFGLRSDASFGKLLEKGKSFCEKKWEVAKNSVAPQPFIDQYCFRAPYVVSLLRDGLQIDDNRISIGSGSITWTLGVALLGASKVHHVYGYGLPDYQALSGPALYIFLFLSLILLFFAVSYVVNCMPRFFQRSYLPLFRQGSGGSGLILNFPYPFARQRWNPINAGESRIKMPLSPRTSATGQARPFAEASLLADTSLHISGGVSHSYSSGSLGQVDGVIGPFWSSHRSQTQLQSRRSQSREDLSASLAEIHLKG